MNRLALVTAAGARHAFVKKTRTTPEHDLAIARQRRKRYRMTDLTYRPVSHNHDELMEKALKREGFGEAYAALADEYSLAHELLAARFPNWHPDPGSAMLHGRCPSQ
jgi:hypothetical protein